jgi:putative toxin-antitoxin system antitoxin component (TIGR02293 family)
VLTSAESDRLYRFIEFMIRRSIYLIKGMTYQWLNFPANGLSGALPINLIRTSTGSNDVLLLIGKIELGVLV